MLADKLASRSRLSHEDREAVLALPATVRMVPRGAYLVREGDRARTACLIVEGFASRHKLTVNGSRQIVAFHIPGDLVDLQNSFLDHADNNVQTLTNATVAFIAVDALRELMRSHSGVAHAALVDTLIDGAIAREWLLNNGRRDARSRLAHLLCEFAARMDMQGLAQVEGHVLPMTQEEIGDALGLTAIHVNRSIRALERDGLITRQNRKIGFPDITALHKAAEFSPLYLHPDILSPILAIPG